MFALLICFSCDPLNSGVNIAWLFTLKYFFNSDANMVSNPGWGPQLILTINLDAKMASPQFICIETNNDYLHFNSMNKESQIVNVSLCGSVI